MIDRTPASDHPWDFVAPFALKHADIRMAVLAVISSDWGRHSLFRLQHLILALSGDEIRDVLIEIARN